jgi:tight adherence protein B
MSHPNPDGELQVDTLIRNFEVCLRSGYSISQAFEIAGKDLTGQTGYEVKLVSEALKNGAGLDTALDDWLGRSPNGDLDLFVATIKVQREVGENLADKLRLLSQIMAHRKGG